LSKTASIIWLGFAKVMNFDAAPFEKMVNLCSAAERPDGGEESG